jgi:hypothetical protein
VTAIAKTVEYRVLPPYFVRDLEDFDAAINVAAADGWRLHSFTCDGRHFFGVVERETLR